MTIRVLLVLLLVLLPAAPAHATRLRAACAANFTAAMKALAADYEQERGVRVRTAFGSTGMLYAQIEHGAPFDLFFAADEARPEQLHQAGRCDAPEVYAVGRVVLWTAKAMDAADWKEALSGMSRVAVANPDTAPYGAAAFDALAAAGLQDAAHERLVFGKNVGQAFQFAHAEAADGAFCALSQAKAAGSGSWWPIPEAPAVRQAACVVSDAPYARAFLDHVLHAPTAARIKAELGYD